jgi:UPF0271 protein
MIFTDMPAGFIDLNADVGEGADDVDEALMSLVTSVSIACGGHAGDVASMKKAGDAATARGIRIGAHPSYLDRENFGRVSIAMGPETLRAEIVRQVRSLIDVTATVSYVKPHGALYNDVPRLPNVATAVFQAVEELRLPLMLMADVATPDSVEVISEGFIDRGYTPDGLLVPRSQAGALITDPAQTIEQALRLAQKVDSLCVHSDTPGAALLMAEARRALTDAGYEITAEHGR